MRQKSNSTELSSEQIVKGFRRATRKRYSAEEKIRIVLDGLRGEHSIAVCRREGVLLSSDYVQASLLMGAFELALRIQGYWPAGRLARCNAASGARDGSRGPQSWVQRGIADVADEMQELLCFCHHVCPTSGLENPATSLTRLAWRLVAVLTNTRPRNIPPLGDVGQKFGARIE